VRSGEVNSHVVGMEAETAARRTADDIHGAKS